MGSTPRDHRYQIPMPVRSTDIQMLGQCPGRWALQLFYEKEQAEASFFGLGSILHEVIETTIIRDLDYPDAFSEAIGMVEAFVASWQTQAEGKRVIESSKRGVDTMLDDARRMIRNWFKFVHPDSDKRLPVYDEYQWPPLVEVSFRKGQAWGQVDAVFASADGGLDLIVDWKSGTQPPKDYDQLDFYRYGMGMGYARAAYHMLDRVRKPSIFIEADEYVGDEEIEYRIADTMEQKRALLDGELPAFNPDWYCNYCPVQEFCPEDGDPKNRKRNLRSLKRMVRLARPMETIGEV